LSCHVLQRAEHLGQAARIDRWKVERCPTRAGGPGLARVELARKQTASERAPGENRQALALSERNDLAFDVATRDRVIDLRALKPREAVGLGETDGFHRHPRGEVAEAYVAGLAAADHVVQRAHGLFDRSDRVESMDLIEVHVVQPEPRQTLLDTGEHTSARQTHLIDPGTDPAANLGRDHELVTGPRQRLERSAQQTFGLSLRVHVGGVDEVHARVERSAQQSLGLLLTQAAHHLPETFSAEGHGSEAQLRDE
jgi:hypothetical protein